MISHKDIQNVCYLKNNTNRQAFYENKKDVFWPFYLWRVTAPKDKSPLNIFQMLILKLVKAGCTANDKLCLYSNLDKELVKYILAQLTMDGYLEGWNITDKAISTLEGKETANQKTSSYYLIQDATSGKLMPRVLSSLPHIESMDFSTKFPRFVMSKGSGNLVSPLLVKNIQSAEQPTAEQMSVCLRAHRRILKQLKQADVYVSDNDFNTNYSIEFIEQEPIAAFMHTRLFSTITGERSWYLSDPVGLTETLPELNEVAEKVLKSNKNFASRVNDVIGIAEQEHVSSYQEQMLQFEEQAKVELISKYSWIQGYELIEKHALATLRLKKQIDESKSPRSEVLEGLLSELQKTIEAWLKGFMKASNQNTDWEILVKRWNDDKPVFQYQRRLVEQIYLRVDGVSSYAANRLATVRGGNVRAALTMGNQSLKPMLAGMLISHPNVVEELSNEFPNWLDKMIRLADDRNQKASHASGTFLSKEEALSHFESVNSLLIVLEKFLGKK